MFEDDSTKLTRRRLLIGATGLVAASLVTPAYGMDLAVIVNPSNKENPSLADLAAIFTTRKQSWGAGKRIIPFNFPAKHPIRVAFDRRVLGMEPDDVARYWIDRRIRGGNAPPKQVSNGRLIARLVEILEGAIAYVPVSDVGGARVVMRF